PRLPPFPSATLFRSLEAALGRAPRIDSQHEHLASPGRSDLRDQLGTAYRRAVDADLVRPGVKQNAHVLLARNPAPDRERSEDGVGRPLYNGEERAPPLVGRGDVEERHLVGALSVVARGRLDRIACIPDVDEVDP